MNMIDNNFLEMESYKTVYKSISDGESRAETVKKLKGLVYKHMTSCSCNAQEMKFAWNAVLKMYNSVSITSSRGIFNNRIAIKAMSYKDLNVFRHNLALKSILNYYITNKTLRQELNKTKNRMEIRQKGESLDSILDKCHKNKSPFVICDYYKDCRNEHKSLQGRIYVDARWKMYIENEKLARRIDKFVNSNAIMTIQEVIRDPFWLVTGKNCRHQLHNLGNNEAMLLKNGTILRKKRLIIRKKDIKMAAKLTIKDLEAALKGVK